VPNRQCTTTGVYNLYITQGNYTMNDLNHNTPRLYNPKANAPAIYIPAWLSQISSKLLTATSKMVYGRLAQWATSSGKAHRSAKQLSEELGMPSRTVEQCLKELRDKNLIGSFVPRDGGHNHFEFYDHPWMHEEINKNLCYQSGFETPSAKSAVPSAKSAVPSAKSAVHKIKEIKEIKENNNARDDSENKELKPVEYQETLYQTNQHLAELSQSDESFMRFWDVYPVKKAKQRAKIAWFAQRCYINHEFIISKLKEQLEKDRQYLDGFAPNPDKYIYEERWNDEIQLDTKRNIKNKRNDSPGWDKDLHLDLI
jgi:hypothetical protein